MEASAHFAFPLRYPGLMVMRSAAAWLQTLSGRQGLACAPRFREGGKGRRNHGGRHAAALRFSSRTSAPEKISAGGRDDTSRE